MTWEGVNEVKTERIKGGPSRRMPSMVGRRMSLRMRDKIWGVATGAGA